MEMSAGVSNARIINKINSFHKCTYEMGKEEEREENPLYATL